TALLSEYFISYFDCSFSNISSKFNFFHTASIASICPNMYVSKMLSFVLSITMSLFERAANFFARDAESSEFIMSSSLPSVHKTLCLGIPLSSLYE
ncbi:MAG: hypothetical protein NZ845_04895, partial [Thermodesulfovibrio sp.]|nr:hypothetical protein [Thermodesulfovibrio sp.]